MNYRHAYHAGNFADVFKHAVLARILAYLTRKDAPLRYLDTHAGRGAYPLDSEAALKTGEWRGGIGRLRAASPPDAVRALLTPYLHAIPAPETYPGSPLIAQRLLRSQDKLTLCELHPRDAPRLEQAVGRDRRVKILTMDGYVALNAYVPPVERRGLVLIDPPFEEADEFDRLREGLLGAWRKWPTGTFLVWYANKDPDAVAGFIGALEDGGLRRALRIELDVEAPVPDAPLASSGLLVVNPPFVLEEELRVLMPWLTQCLTRGAGACWRMGWLAELAAESES